jgi:hypothetical protein
MYVSRRISSTLTFASTFAACRPSHAFESVFECHAHGLLQSMSAGGLSSLVSSVARLQLPLSPMLEDGITHRLDKVGCMRFSVWLLGCGSVVVTGHMHGNLLGWAVEPSVPAAASADVDYVHAVTHTVIVCTQPVGWLCPHAVGVLILPLDSSSVAS